MLEWLRWNKDEVITFLVVVCLIIVVIFASVKLSDVSCSAKVENMGFNYRWSIFGGCQIEVKPNQWIPLEHYYFKQQ